MFEPGEARVRAVWRALLGFPLLLVPGLVVGLVVGVLGVSGMLPTGLVQAGAFLVLLAVFAMFVDRRPLAEYGVESSQTWVLKVLGGFVAVILGHVIWISAGSMLGWTSISGVASAPSGRPVAIAAAMGLAALAVNIWVQETVYFAVVGRAVAEGVRNRGVTARRAVLGGLVGGAVFMALSHEGTLQRPELLFAGLVFGALYVQTGDLGLSIGAHLGVNFSGHALFVTEGVGERVSIFYVVDSMPGVIEWASAARLPQLLIGYVLVLAVVYWRTGDVGVVEGLAGGPE